MESVEFLNKEFWRGRKVLITGHNGFKGSWLSLWLLKMGAEVTGYALMPPTNPNLFDLLNIAEDMQTIFADIRDKERLIATVRQTEPEVIFHMAAQPLVLDAYQEPVETYATNVMGTVHILEALRSITSVRAAVIVTSDKCYENKEWIWGYREYDTLGGYDPYSNSKACAELVTAAYRNSFFSPELYSQHGVSIASVRAGNVIGGGDWAPGRLLSDCMRATLAGESILVRNPSSIRPWQFVLEPLSGYLTLAEKLVKEGPFYAQSWNFGPQDSDMKSVEYVVNTFCELWGTSAQFVVETAKQAHEARCL